MNKKLALAGILVVMITVIALGILIFTHDSDSDSDNKIPTVGILSPNDESALNFIKQPMEELGYVEGKTVHYMVKIVSDPAEYDAAARSLVDEHVDVIYSVEVPGVLAASKLTTDIPIVFFVDKELFVTDIAPIRDRQGIKTNLTGFAAANPAGKRFGLLMKIVPTIKTVYVPYNPSLLTSLETLALVEEAAAIYEVALVKFEFTDDAGAQRALEEIPQGIDAIFLGDEIPMMIRLLAFADAAIARQVPLAAPVTQFGDLGKFPPGILLGYGGGIQDTYKQVAELIDQTLRGKAPADLVIRSSSIYFTVSLGAAEALGIEISDDILRQADQVLKEKVIQAATVQGTQPVPAAGVACNATLKVPSGESTLCVEASCDVLQESGFATFTDKVEVERCSTENVMGVCVSSVGNTYYYSGVTATIQNNCASRGGEWKTSVE
jgi:putative ABC transport system substrate-binding protein